MVAWILALVVTLILFCVWFANKEADLYWQFVLHMLSEQHWASGHDMVVSTDGVLSEQKVEMVLERMYLTGRAERSRHGIQGRWLYRKMTPKSE